jgi:DNA ligase 1
MEGGVLLAETAEDDMDPTGWYGSEKMDGVRAVWSGSTFYSRNGNEFFPPSFFVKNFPKSTLDGELFTKRDDF